MSRTSLAAILVREVADDRLSHGDVTFAIGFIAIVGGGIVAMATATALRLAGFL